MLYTADDISDPIYDVRQRIPKNCTMQGTKATTGSRFILDLSVISIKIVQFQYITIKSTRISENSIIQNIHIITPFEFSKTIQI